MSDTKTWAERVADISGLNGALGPDDAGTPKERFYVAMKTLYAALGAHVDNDVKEAQYQLRNVILTEWPLLPQSAAYEYMKALTNSFYDVDKRTKIGTLKSMSETELNLHAAVRWDTLKQVQTLSRALNSVAAQNNVSDLTSEDQLREALGTAGLTGEVACRIVAGALEIARAPKSMTGPQR